MLRGEEQSLFGDCTCNYATSHFWYQIFFENNFHPPFLVAPIEFLMNARDISE